MPTRYFKRVIKRLIPVRDDELNSLLQGSSALFCILSAYFGILPLRDEVGVSLGTAQLPALFSWSFVITLIATPCTSFFLSRPHVPRNKAMQHFFRILAISLIAFFFLFIWMSPASSTGSSDQPEGTARTLLEMIGGSHNDAEEQAVPISSPLRQPAPTHARLGDVRLTGMQRGVRAALFLWISAINLIAISTVWARMADIFSSEAGTRLFGFLGAGATLGQLCGSLISAAWSRYQKRRFGSKTSGSALTLQLVPLLTSALLYEAAGRFLLGLEGSTVPGQGLTSRAADSPARKRAPQRMRQGLGKVGEGFVLISRSSYLLHICAFLWLSTIISSFMYFEKAMVVAGSSGDAASRMTIFASMNVASALVIAVLQIFATANVLRRVGVASGLAASPAFGSILMLLIALWPTPIIVGLAEVLRKVVVYSMARPAREILFTVMSREEKYSAKICIDTIVLRAGDMVAAGLFHVLDGVFQLGPSACAVAAVPVCVACFITAFLLGRRHAALSKLEDAY